MDCENCWQCSAPTECSSKDEEKKVFSSILSEELTYFQFLVDIIGHFLSKCMEIANEKQIECLSNCNGDECQTCNQVYQNDVDNCPCRKNCPGKNYQEFLFFEIKNWTFDLIYQI